MMKFLNIKDALTYVESSRSKRSFEEFKEIVHTHHFQTSFPQLIHVAGTNGKGSTVTWIRSLLQVHGYKVATFTSPYMITHNDRICINGEPISDQVLLQYINELYDLIERYHCSMFEIDVLIMLRYFQDHPVDYYVVETGIGGKEDKTNVLESMFSVITNIGYDHQFMLGNTLQEITHHKCGIIKPNQQFFTSQQDNQIMTIMNDYCQKQDTKMHVVPNCTEFKMDHLAPYQQRNFCLAYDVVCACCLVDKQQVQEVINQYQFIGRFQKIGKYYLDGAHNIPGIIALKEAIEDKKMKNCCIVFSALVDKDVTEMLDLLKEYPCFECRFKDDRAKKGVPDFKEVLQQVDELYDTIIVTGSLHFISEVHRYLCK